MTDKVNQNINELIRAHYKNPIVKSIIIDHAKDGDLWKAGNGDFKRWYKEIGGNQYRLFQLDNPKDYDYLTTHYRTLYQTLNWWSAKVKDHTIPTSLHNSDGEKVTIGDFSNTLSYNLGIDIDVVGKIQTPENKKAVETCAQFLINKLKNICPNSIYCCFSGGGIYVYIHHGIFTEVVRYDKEREYRWKITTECYNVYIRKLEEDFLKQYPKYKGKVKVDPINNRKRLFKTILSVHKKYPYVVIPLDIYNIQIDLKKATLPLDDAVIMEAKDWGKNFNTKDRKPLLKKLKEYIGEIKVTKDDDLPHVIRKSDTKIDTKYFPPCIQKALTIAREKGKSKMVGASRIKAVVTTFLYKAGYNKEEAKAIFNQVSKNVGGPDTNIFDSFFGVIECPHCTSINRLGAVFPHLYMGDIKLCNPDNDICTFVKERGTPYNYLEKSQQYVIVEKELDEIQHKQQKETSKTEIMPVYDNSFIGRYCYYQNLITNAPFQFSQHLIIALLGHVMGRDTVNRIQPKAVPHNIYLLLVGPSGKARKSTAQENAKNIYVQETELPDGFSPEGLLKAMAETPKGIVWPAELSELLRGIIQGGPKATFKEIANAMHGCPHAYKKRLARDKDSYIVPYPYLSAISTCTEEGLFPCMTPDLIHGGFLARWMMSYGVSQYRKRCKIPDEAEKLESEFRAAFRNLSNIFEKQHIIFELTENGFDALDEICRDLEENPYWDGVEPFVARYSEYIVAYADVLRFSDLLGEYGIPRLARLAHLSYLIDLSNTTKTNNIVCVKDDKEDKLDKDDKYVKDDTSLSSTLIIPIDSSYIQRAWDIIEPCLEYTRKFVKYVDEDFILAKLEHVFATHCPISHSRAMQYSHLKKKDFDECVDTLESRETVFQIHIIQKIKNQQYTKIVYCLRQHIDTQKCKKCEFKCNIDQRHPPLTKMPSEQNNTKLQQKPEIKKSSLPPIYLESDETKEKQTVLDHATNIHKINDYFHSVGGDSGFVSSKGFLAFLKNILNKKDSEKYLSILKEKGIVTEYSGKGLAFTGYSGGS